MASNGPEVGHHKESIIASSKMLRVLGAQNLEDLTFHSRIATAKRDDLIWKYGSDVNFVGVLGEGFVKMAHPAIKGHAYILDLFGPGQVFGLTSVVTGVDCPKSAIALNDVTFVKIPKQIIHQLYEACDQFKHQIVLRLSERMRLGSELLDTLSNGHADQKIAAVLLVLFKNYAVDGPVGPQIEIPLTRKLISSMAGTTVESAIRVLSRWQKAGVVRTDDRHVTILDESALIDVMFN